jgi:ankyrin repeat protein
MRLKQTLLVSPFVYANSSAWQNQDLIPRVCLNSFIGGDSEPHQACQQIRLLVEQGYDVNSTLNGQICLHNLFLKSHSWLRYLPEYMDLLSYLIEHGADVYAEDYDGYQPSHYAYGATCEACYLFCTSARGDLWDAALTYVGYDILETRRFYPRKARYITGYTRGDFEKFWYGQEGNCPYWDDRPWPPTSEQDDAARSSWPPMRGELCELCRTCVDDFDCFNCGVCLSSFQFFCDDSNHQHNRFCPREQIAVWKLQEDGDEVYWELVPFSDSESDYDVSSSEDSDGGGILLQVRLEEAFSDALSEGVSRSLV